MEKKIQKGKIQKGKILEYLMLVRVQGTLHTHTPLVTIQIGVYNLIETKVPLLTENHRMHIPFTN